MWLGIWSGRRRDEEKWEQFVARYHEFKPADCVILCPDHHAEIHALYDFIIHADKTKLKKNLAEYSWRQAEKLMTELKNACLEWLPTTTPGISSTNYGVRKRRRKMRR